VIVLTGDHWTIHVADVLEGLKSLPDASVHCCVTSPPYWSQRDYGFEGQIGLEPTADQYVQTLVRVFREVRRVLRDDGTLWVNLGDTYCKDSKFGGASGSKHQPHADAGAIPRGYRTRSGLQRGDMVGIPWRVARALQRSYEDFSISNWFRHGSAIVSEPGWVLRSCEIWHKPASMPESVSGVRWIRKGGEDILKRGTWRPSVSHEYVFQFAKKSNYFCDGDGSKEPVSGGAHSRGNGSHPKQVEVTTTNRSLKPKQNNSFLTACSGMVETRNLRSVWRISSASYKGSHFAAFPPELVRMILSAAISKGGCCSACGEQLAPIVEKLRFATRPGKTSKIPGRNSRTFKERDPQHSGEFKSERFDEVRGNVSQHVESPYHEHSGSVCGNRDPLRHTTVTKVVGYRPTCKCNAAVGRPTVLDCFAGSCTTGQVATRMGCEFIGIEANPEYARLGRERIQTDWVPIAERKKPTKRRKKVRQQKELFS
jgi:DNA modification methylase